MRKKLKYQYSVAFEDPDHDQVSVSVLELKLFLPKPKLPPYCLPQIFFHAFHALFLRFARAYRVIMKLVCKFSEFF